MNLLSDIITYIRRIIKSPSNSVISDTLLIDYINRFWIADVDARIQLFDLKTKYQFQTVPGVDQYNMPLYDLQYEPAGQTQQYAGMYPVYQGFLAPAYVNGIPISFHTEKTTFFNNWINVVQQMFFIGTGDGVTLNFPFTLPVTPNNIMPTNLPWQYFLRGHVDITGVIATGNNVDPPSGTTINKLIPSTSIFPAFYITSIDSTGNSIVVQDSGQFLGGFPNNGLLMIPGTAPFGYQAFGSYNENENTFNYLTGQGQVTFPTAPAAGAAISAQAFLFQSGLPRGVLFNNNTLTFRSPPDRQYLVEIDAYLSPSAFLSQPNAIPFGYMAEYIARGAARKILADTGDQDQFAFYEPLFAEQEALVWKRSQRQFTATRTQTLYSQGNNQGSLGNTLGAQTF